ncbi:DMT family transporter [Brachyspira catarrhinii]|uniref:Guanidinium exporter n=1 Tax=Brachyspira catarrhinii TaxID=2528966 RepID=A0ABY2TQU1_9SPIR|nr:multidrug efflux SMR transporter [Brachyspira catarrhinii]TKZ35257.1 multidrug efflux SMR transporter [Brachyspira catarrhinii]
MEWIYLILAGILEIFWATCLKLSNGFTILKFSILTITGMVFSFVFLAQATKILPLGTSYAIWTGIGALGSVIIGIILFKEVFTLPKVLFVTLLLIGIIGLKVTSSH